MTISDALKSWLSTYPGLELVGTDRLEADPESYGLYKQPTIEEVKYIDGSSLRTEFYYFLARQNAQQEIDRRESYDFLESLEAWVDRQLFEENVPKIDGFEDIGIMNSFYLQDETVEEAVYQIGIYVTYLRRNNNDR